MKIKNKMPYDWGSDFVSRHPILANIAIITIIAILGIYAVYVAIALFTKHGQSDELPGVEGKTYTEAISILHNHGFKVDIRDSLYREDIKPGYVIEQFPKAHSIVKPGRKIFLYINAVNPKQVVLDDMNRPNEYALKGESYRGVMAKLTELGFKNVKVVRVLGTTDRVVKITANGKPVHKMEKIPVNVQIIVEISDGRLLSIKDSLQYGEVGNSYESEYQEEVDSEPAEGEVETVKSENNSTNESESENSSYFD